MSDLYKPQTLKLYAQQAGSVRLTLDWFANKAFYPPRAGVHIKPLINGQAAFDAVHAAMEAARQSIDIITWGFDPAMRFKRPDGPRIGELLQTKGRAGVQARPRGRRRRFRRHLGGLGRRQRQRGGQRGAATGAAAPA